VTVANVGYIDDNDDELSSQVTSLLDTQTTWTWPMAEEAASSRSRPYMKFLAWLGGSDL
jgi:hypothetical protein